MGYLSKCTPCFTDAVYLTDEKSLLLLDENEEAFEVIRYQRS